jgi:hypothetical protein
MKAVVMTVIAGSDRQSGSPIRSGMTASQAGDDRIEMFKTDYIMEMMRKPVLRNVKDTLFQC